MSPPIDAAQGYRRTNAGGKLKIAHFGRNVHDAEIVDYRRDELDCGRR